MLSRAGTGNAAHRMSCHQIPAELIQLDPDCISKVRTTSTPCEGEGEEGRRRKYARGRAGGKSEALKRQKRKEEQGKVRKAALYHNMKLSLSYMQARLRQAVHAELSRKRQGQAREEGSSEEEGSEEGRCEDTSQNHQNKHVLDRFR